jgi:hypothetical protein
MSIMEWPLWHNETVHQQIEKQYSELNCTNTGIHLDKMFRGPAKDIKLSLTFAF